VDYALPVAFAIAAWWLSTVVLIYRAGLPRATFFATFAGTTVFMVAGVAAIVAFRNSETLTGVYLSFLGGLSIWAWHEVSYLFGFISGPRPEACPEDATGWRRFIYGVRTCVYHELAIVATAIALIVLSISSVNQVGVLTFVILWLMRWSAKLNIFLGVRNLHEEFWPDHLDYLKTYVRRRPMNELFPVSMLVGAIVFALLTFAAIDAGDDTARRTGAALLATLLALAIVEHVLLVLRIRDDALWLPALRARRDDGVRAG
jgi:putative photosynthetic complex assembly protein 2